MINLLNHADVIWAAASRALNSTFGMSQVGNFDQQGNFLGIDYVEKSQYQKSASERVISLYQPWLSKVFFDAPKSTIPTKAMQLYLRDIRQLRSSGNFTTAVEHSLQQVRKSLESIEALAYPTSQLHRDDFLVVHNLEGARQVTNEERDEIEQVDYLRRLWWHLIGQYADNLRPRLIQELHWLSESSIWELNCRYQSVRGDWNHRPTDDQLDQWLTWQPVLELPVQTTNQDTPIPKGEERGTYTKREKAAILEAWEKAKCASILKAEFVVDYSKRIGRSVKYVAALLNAAQTDQRRENARCVQGRSRANCTR